MPLIHNTYGKARVRVMRVHRDGDYNEVRELSVQTMLEGEFGRAYTAADNRTSVATDTIKNITYIVARENMQASAEVFAAALAARFHSRYPQVERVTVSTKETRWTRASFDGTLHPHGFTLNANGMPTTQLVATRGEAWLSSGIAGYTFMKSTASGWDDFVYDEYTTLAPTTDRLAATAMDAVWTWTGVPADYDATNAKILDVMLEVFATTYSHSVQNSLFRMGEAALAAVPEIGTIRMACPNKHYIPMNLDAFGMSSDNMVFIATDEPHGQIECVVGR